MKQASFALVFAALMFGCSQESNPIDSLNQNGTEKQTKPQRDNLPISVSKDLFLVFIPEHDSVAGETEITAPISAALGGDIKIKVMYFKNGVKQLSVSGLIKFPAGALDQDRDITLSLDPQALAFEFLPHGITFSTPVLLTIDTYGLDLTEFQSGTDLWYVENGQWIQSFQGEWIILNPEQGKLMVKDIPLEHFSRYAFGR